MELSLGHGQTQLHAKYVVESPRHWALCVHQTVLLGTENSGSESYDSGLQHCQGLSGSKPFSQTMTQLFHVSQGPFYWSCLPFCYRDPMNLDAEFHGAYLPDSLA